MHVRDIDQQQFGPEVLQRSHEVPVVVDFWAEWCGPCKVLGPTLEKAAADYEGKFELVKVDVDANQELSRQFGIQSIPTVMAFRGGEPVSRFSGAVPDTALRQWIDQILPSEADLKVDRARDLVLEGDEAAGEALYREILADTPDHADAATALAALLIARGDTEEALIVLGKLPKTSEVERLEAAARLTSRSHVDLSDLEQRVAAAPGDDTLRIELGQALAAKGEHEPALDHLLAVVRSAGPQRDMARQAMVDVFEVLGPEHPLAATYRRALANELF